MAKNTLLFLTTLCLSVSEVYSQPVVDPDKYVDDGKPAQFTCKDTLKTGEVLAWYQTKDLVTGKNSDQEFHHYAPVSGTSLRFKVRARNDAHVGITARHSYRPPMYVFVFGGNSNRNSMLRRDSLGDEVIVPTPDILNASEFRGFWVSWEKGELTMGREGDETPIAKWQDPRPFTASYYGINTCWGCSGTWKIEGRTWMTEDKLLRVTQQHGEEQSVELTLEKTLEQSDDDTWVYCAKQSVQRGGSFAPFEGEAESQRIHIEFQNTKPPLEIPFNIELKPNLESVNFTVNSRLTFTCSGSPTLDGRNYTWFRKVSDSDSNLTLPEIQSYDAEASRNELTLSPDKSYDQNQMFCRQGYVAYIIDPDGAVFIKSYGVVNASGSIILNFEETDDDLLAQMWVALAAMLGTMLVVGVVTFLLLMACVQPTCSTEKQEA